MSHTTDPISATIDGWHRFLKGELPGGLDELLHDDVVFLSPIVFSPQVGKDITTMYLTAAGTALAGKQGAGASTPKEEAKGFRYIKEVISGHHAVLEFETSIGDVAVNGVDIITCDDDGKIVEFKVMVRPLKAVNAVHAQMGAMLESMKSNGS